MQTYIANTSTLSFLRIQDLSWAIPMETVKTV